MIQVLDRFGIWLAGPIRRWRIRSRLRAIAEMRRDFDWRGTDAEIERKIYGDNLEGL